MTREKTILLYVRPWNVSQMEHLARGVWGENAQLEFASEHIKVDGCDLAVRFNEAYRQTEQQTLPRHLTEDETADITLRCRLLRSLKPKRARRLVVAMEHAVDAVLSETKPEAMLSLTIDSYVMDIFSILCRKRGVRFIGLVPSFIKEHFRITARGEYVASRSVTEAEIDAALTALIVKDYRPDFLVQSTREMHKQMWRLWRRNLPKPLWFAMLRMRRRETLNYHYWASQIVSKRFWSAWPRSLNGISGPDLAALEQDGGAGLIYVPLQMSPEATIDYWSTDIHWIDYENFILALVRKYRTKWRFLIKEHPNLLGLRSRGFYAKLKAEPNCVIVSPKVPSNDLVSLCDGVVVCTGTSGFEAALRGKPVLTDSEPYYASNADFLPISALDGDLHPEGEDGARQRRLVAHVLRGILQGRFLNNGTWSADDPEHRNWSDTMAASIRSYLDVQEFSIVEAKIYQETSVK